MKRVSILLIIAALFVGPLTAQSALKGYTVGINVGLPVVGGAYYDNTDFEPVFGIVIGTPYGLPLGPFNIGANVGIESANGLFGLFAIANASVFETPNGPISVFGGVGLLEGLGIIGGASYDYAIPNQPIVAKPYLRGNLSTGAANDEPTYWIHLGVMVTYAL
ncbi:MAG: hypothetical protein IIB95_09805 [Candidatus Marinimicrobia bacterium]|nr:hypothetical protein [Candidatus Neomarinimicrobiota bacterium]MCH7764019.1 hypothetical protein [Candidatus Neomarinimicrobiota bacterium]